MEIGPKETTSGRRRSFVLAKFDLGGGETKVATTGIRSVKLHNPEPLRPAADNDGGERADAYTNDTTGDTTITYLVSIRVFKAPAPDPLNDEAFRVVVTQPMTETPVQTLSTLTEAGGSVMGAAIAHVMDASTVDMPPPPPLPQLSPLTLFIRVPLTLLPLPPIPDTCNLPPHSRSPGVRTTTISH